MKQGRGIVVFRLDATKATLSPRTLMNILVAIAKALLIVLWIPANLSESDVGGGQRRNEILREDVVRNRRSDGPNSVWGA
jgi:hypothetical protein